MRTWFCSLVGAMASLALLTVLPGGDGTAAPPEVDVLIKQLKEKDKEARLRAANELGTLKEAAVDAIPALSEATKDADENVRKVARQSLEAIQQAAIQQAVAKDIAEKKQELIQRLIKNLQSKDNKVKLAAIDELEKMGPAAKEAGPALVEYGMMSMSPKVREMASGVFNKIDRPVHKEVAVILTDKDEANKLQAVANLRAMGAAAKSAIPAMKLLASQKTNRARTLKVAESLEILAAMTDIAPDDPSIQGAVLAYVAGKNQSERTAAIGLMSKIQIGNLPKYYALNSAFGIAQSPKDRVQIINEIAKLGADSKAGLPGLMKLRNDPNPEVRRAAESAIEAIRD